MEDSATDDDAGMTLQTTRETFRERSVGSPDVYVLGKGCGHEKATVVLAVVNGSNAEQFLISISGHRVDVSQLCH